MVRALRIPKRNPFIARLEAAVLVGLVASCATRPLPAPTVLVCAPPCAEIRKVTFPETVTVAVRAPPGSQLKNAMLTSSAARACGSGVPVKLVDVDGQQYSEGPATLVGNHTLELRFPFTASGNDAPDAGLSRPVSLDLDLRTPAGDHCIRLNVPETTPGVWSGMNELSYRMEPHP